MLIKRILILVLATATTLMARSAGGGERSADGSPFFRRGEDWVETMLASRRRYLELYTAEEVELGPWFSTPPRPAESFAQTHFPAGSVDLDALDEAGRSIWTRRDGYIDGKVHSLPLMDHASTYLTRTIHASEPVSLTASLGSDDGIEVWLNEEKILSRDVPRGVAPDQDRAVLNLVEGENRLLLKIHNRAGGFGFYFLLKRDPLVALWDEIERNFPTECYRMAHDLPEGLHLRWFRATEDSPVSAKMVASVLQDTAVSCGDLYNTSQALGDAAAPDGDGRWLELYEDLCSVRELQRRLDAFDLAALRRAVEDLTEDWPDDYDRRFLLRLTSLESSIPEIKTDLLSGNMERSRRAGDQIDRLEDLRREALLANPLLDFDELLLIKRDADSPSLGLPQNWQGNCSLPRTGYDDEMCTLWMGDLHREPARLFKPDQPRLMADLDLHFDGNKILFSMIGSHDRWQIFELSLDGMELRQVTAGEYDDVDNYDACYLPDGRIIFDSTRCFQGIPCVGGADAVANLYLLDEKADSIRQLFFDQDHNWCPAVLNDGRVLFTRWEYSDTPHYFTRLLMHMNPDGTGQMEFYGSNSYWPNSIFYARPIPDHPTKVVAIVSGHHGVARMGELIIFDPALGRFEADGVVQRIPGFGEEVEPVIRDQLVNQSWPRFLHPFPLSDKYFIVSCKPEPRSPWGVYLVDVFDNLLLLAEEPGFALLEPIPRRARRRPPVIPDKVRLAEKEATVFLADIYQGPGLAGVPRGTVKELRLFAFHYGYNNMGGHAHVGLEGPWDVHRILGTVPVHSDGSAGFIVPANTPIALQPLDDEGKALQLMRSWFTAMPGEILSCVGCHEPQNTTTPVRPTIAALQRPVEIKPWRGPARGFSFKREVQPVLDRHCVGCHDGGDHPDGRPNLSRRAENGWGNFTPSYLALHPYVRRPGPESDYHLLRPLEFHANTSELVQMLKKGHHGVELDGESWDRLITWIDLNVPDHGTWAEYRDIPAAGRARRCEMSAKYAALTGDPEMIPAGEVNMGPFVRPLEQPAAETLMPEIRGWPFNRKMAESLQERPDAPGSLALDLGDGVRLELKLIPKGEFLMGSTEGYPDEKPPTPTRIAQPFYMGATEVTCEQYARFDSGHFNGYHDQRHKDHTRPGYAAHGPDRPVIRVSWEDAMAFCQWLSAETGYECSLPTEAEWEWACRAGTDTPFHYGDMDSDFSAWANLADISTRKLAVTGVDPKPIANPNEYLDFLPKDARFNDGEILMCDVGKYEPNAWGLHDMHGNVCEWTLSDYLPYPDIDDAPASGQSDKVVRGGSWRDRPGNARSSWRMGYRRYQCIYNVGFRVVVHP